MKTNHNLLVLKQKLAFTQTDFIHNLLYLFIVISVHFTYN